MGSAIVRKLERRNIRIIMAGRDQLNLLQQQAVLILQGNQIDEVVVAATKVEIHQTTVPRRFSL